MLGRHRSPPNCRLYGGSAKIRSTLLSGSEANVSRLSPCKVQSRGSSIIYLSSVVRAMEPPSRRALRKILLYPGEGHLWAQRVEKVGRIGHVDPKAVLGVIFVSEAGQQHRIFY